MTEVSNWETTRTNRIFGEREDEIKIVHNDSEISDSIKVIITKGVCRLTANSIDDLIKALTDAKQILKEQG